jgi:hypothetical protein
VDCWYLQRIGTIDTGDGNDTITGIIEKAGPRDAYAIFTAKSTIDTGDGNDTITGITPRGTGIFSRDSTINTGDGNDIISGLIEEAGPRDAMPFSPQKVRLILVMEMTQSLALPPRGTGIFSRDSTINTGDGNDIISGLIEEAGPRDAYAIFTTKSTIDTGDGNDTITDITPRGTGIFSRDSTIAILNHL